MNSFLRPAAVACFALAATAAICASASSPAPALVSAPGADGVATAPARVRAEIARLLADLRGSGCRFERNGRWYDAERAAAHLQRKLDHAGDTAIPDTETFIVAAATKSSLSGRAYRVQCGNAPPVESARWFRGRLERIRAASSQLIGRPRPRVTSGHALPRRTAMASPCSA